jgi:hypothetical protein
VPGNNSAVNGHPGESFAVAQSRCKLTDLNFNQLQLLQAFHQVHAKVKSEKTQANMNLSPIHQNSASMRLYFQALHYCCLNQPRTFEEASSLPEYSINDS